jgi:hypothetical protein
VTRPKPHVFRGEHSHRWYACYAPGQFDSFPSFREAFDHAFTIARLRGIVTETLREM